MVLLGVNSKKRERFRKLICVILLLRNLKVILVSVRELRNNRVYWMSKERTSSFRAQ